MNDKPPRLRRFRDLKIVGDLEAKAILDPALRSPSGGPDAQIWIDACQALFGVEEIDPYSPWPDVYADQAALDAHDRKLDAFYDAYDAAYLDGEEQVKGFAALGWDVAGPTGRPLYVMEHLAVPLLAAIRGEYGARLPDDTAMAEAWGGDLAAEARRFRPTRR